MKVGIIGCGNLGKALVKGLLYTDVNPQDIRINVKTEQTKERVKAEFPDVCVIGEKRELVEWADAVIVVVEPKNAAEVLREVGTCDLSGKCVISFMAGITREEIKQMLGEQGEKACLVRVMPNVSIANGKGILGITYDVPVQPVLQEILRMFDKLGYVLKVEEEGLNTITVTAASGLAFAASMLNAYQNAGNTLLENEEASREITLRVFENVLDLIKKENLSFADLVARIATKGGTTEAGMNALDQKAVTDAMTQCMKASYEKCKKIV